MKVNREKKGRGVGRGGQGEIKSEEMDATRRAGGSGGEMVEEFDGARLAAEEGEGEGEGGKG